LIYPGQVLVIREGGSVTPPTGATTYTVQRNDNLTEIAARFGTTVSELVRLNNIQNPNLIYPGQVLVIREGGSVTPPTGATTYTVQRGDTLSEIAERFGTTVSELVRLNSIADRDRIYPGQVLLLPQNGCVDTYIVQRGDTLSEIAERFGTTVARLAGINGIRNADRIYVGQVLFLGIC
ncbi:MAG TPA: LysM peptidoglycan-binding domain-containing protein, partial [Candidatus Pullichristensenella avicola]|nr:LysM peptidoglycan-binding domain-containing protein [Candidatus Pullichristensenella avicola]